MIAELDTVVLTQDLPEQGLREGDLGTVVMIYKDNAAYEVEFVTLDGETVSVATLIPTQIREIKKGEMPHARNLAA
jgi:hypothetical protein